MNLQLEGRVFERLGRYQALPEEVRMQTDAAGAYLLSADVKQRVFTSKDWLHLTSALCVRGKNLVDNLMEFLKSSNAEVCTIEHANVLAEALVLSGFLAPIRESEQRKEMFVGEKDYLELVADPALLENKKKTSVWQVADGAECAGKLLRVKNNMLGIRSRKEVYAVVNVTKHKSIFFFANDVARDFIGQIELENAQVEYVSDDIGASSNVTSDPEVEKKPSSSNMEFAIRITKDSMIERIVFETKQKQDEWMIALVKAGAVFKEDLLRVEGKTLYELQDLDCAGETISMSQYKGKVLLLVNFASLDDLASQQFADLISLQDMFGSKGLEVLGFACDQFGGKEPNFGRELMTELASTFKLNFKVFDRRDVNGPDARDVFLLMKHLKPLETKGPFVEWNFVKFLVDRSGNVMARYDAQTSLEIMQEAISDVLLEKELKEPVPAEASAETTTSMEMTKQQEAQQQAQQEALLAP